MKRLRLLMILLAFLGCSIYAAPDPPKHIQEPDPEEGGGSCPPPAPRLPSALDVHCAEWVALCHPDPICFHCPDVTELVDDHLAFEFVVGAPGCSVQEGSTRVRNYNSDIWVKVDWDGGEPGSNVGVANQFPGPSACAAQGTCKGTTCPQDGCEVPNCSLCRCEISDATGRVVPAAGGSAGDGCQMPGCAETNCDNDPGHCSPPDWCAGLEGGLRYQVSGISFDSGGCYLPVARPISPERIQTVSEVAACVLPPE